MFRFIVLRLGTLVRLLRARRSLLLENLAPRQQLAAYYKWERRALVAMVEALGNREHGRPPLRFDPEKEALQR
jgi:hypothetical protein